MRLKGLLLLLISIGCLLMFIAGPFLLSKILPDHQTILANFMCGLGGLMSSPVVKTGLLHVAIFSLLLSIIISLFLPRTTTTTYRVLVFGIVFILAALLLALFLLNKPLPWVSGDDLGFATSITLFLTFFALAPLLKHNKSALLGTILLVFLLFWGIYKFGGVFLAREAEKRGAEDCLEEFPVEVPTLDEEGKIVKKRIPYDIFKPTYIVGALLSLIALVFMVIAIFKM